MANCGPLIFDFFDENGELESNIFIVEASDSEVKLVVSSERDGQTGDYLISYRVWLEKYPEVSAVVAQGFRVTIEASKSLDFSAASIRVAPKWYRDLPRDIYVIAG